MANLQISKAQDGQTIVAGAGDVLALELPSNPTTGYKWDFASIDENVVGIEHADYEPAGTAPGSGGVDRWTLRARSPGKTRLELKRFRPWGGDHSIVERFKITLDIKSARIS